MTATELAAARPRAALLPMLPVLPCAGLALALAAHHPLQPLLAVLLCAALAALAWRWWREWPLLLPAALPLLGLAPWTGWISFEEMDMLVLASAAGGYAGWATRASTPVSVRLPAWQRPLRWSGLSRLLMLAYALALALATWRGVQDAGGWSFGWYQGYHEPMNSLRLAKAFFAVALLLPLWRAACETQPPQRLQRNFGAAMTAVLLICALAALQERLAYTGLLNFSTDYRTTGPFWEMHVGGAALDGALALGLPFAVAWLLRERRPAWFVALLGINLLGAYAALTTFSRGVYLALPLGLALTALLTLRQRRWAAADLVAPSGARGWQRHTLPLAVLAAYAVAAALLFPGGGWRALLALCGNALLFFALPPLRLLLAQTRAQRLLLIGLALLAALLGTALCAVLSVWVPKGEYLSYSASFALTALLVWRNRAGIRRQREQAALLAAWLWNLGLVGVVCASWGGELAGQAAVLPLLGLLAAWLLLLLAPGEIGEWLPRTSLRDKALLWTGLLVLVALVGGLGGGAYIGDRASTVQRDLQGRLDHWRLTLDLLQGSDDWLFGKGTGRFPASYFFGGERSQQVGDYRLRDAEPGQQYLTLTGGKHVQGWGEMFRITQRIAVPSGELTLRLRVRSSRDVSLHADVCEKHLLYPESCLVKELAIKSEAGRWQPVELTLGRAPPMGGSWWAPRRVAFSLALGSSGASADIDEVELRDAQGALLANGDFSQGMAQWFFSSDRHHMPWHAKSMAVHLLFEQGLLGLALASLITVAALWRCTLGHARNHALAPALAGALLGFLVVGLFDSLLDAPRVALLFWCVTLLALGLRALPPPRPSR
jgi:hypothetical protein